MKHMHGIAIALFVKNEAYDIAAWISWHFALGVDKLYIYDDHSTDGTYEIVKAASSILNISLKKTDISKETNFFWRQRDSYIDACEQAKGKYDWIGFLDADEYVSLENNKSLGEYFSKLNSFNAIALNWRIFGSSRRVLRGHLPPYIAYIHHSLKDFPDNALVKTFAKPGKVLNVYQDPHRFYVDDDNYGDSLGRKFDWRGSCKDVEWGGARINHYICRSMESYVGRIRRRIGSDLENSSVYWEHFDRNDIEIRERSDFTFESNNYVVEIKKKCVNLYISYFNNKEFPVIPNLKEPGAKVYRIFSAHGEEISLIGSEGFLTQKMNEDSLNVVGIVYNSNQETLYIANTEYSVVQNNLFYIREDRRRKFCYEFSIDRSGGEGLVYLKSTSSDNFLSFLPQSDGFKIECNRVSPSGWERCTLEEIDFKCEEFFFCPHGINDLSAFFTALENFGNIIKYNDFIIMLSNLSESDLTFIKHSKEGSVISFLL